MLVNSEMLLPVGADAPRFRLPNYQNNIINGAEYSLDKDDSANVTVVMFICNHCPYVIHIKDRLCEIVSTYKSQGVNFIGINSNDIVSHPQDGPEFMMSQGFDFPYLYDESQEVAKVYKAACTPDFYVFDKDLICFYRGRFDSSTPGNLKEVTGEDLVKALDTLINIPGEVYPGEQLPSMGCNIKWRV